MQTVTYHSIFFLRFNSFFFSLKGKMAKRQVDRHNLLSTVLSFPNDPNTQATTTAKSSIQISHEPKYLKDYPLHFQAYYQGDGWELEQAELKLTLNMGLK